MKLQDHQGFPLVFGVCSESVPFWMILQFHGDRSHLESLNIHHTLSEKNIVERAMRLEFVRKFAEALLHIHKVGFLHNDIKSKNVIFDIAQQSYNPLIIDFVKSLPTFYSETRKDMLVLASLVKTMCCQLAKKEPFVSRRFVTKGSQNSLPPYE